MLRTPNNFGCSIGRRYRASDARGVSLGLAVPEQRVQGFDAFTNIAARLGFGTPNLAEATEYNLDRMSNNYMLLITLYRNHWISRKIVDTPAKDMVRAWPTLTSDIDPADVKRIDRAVRKTNTKGNILSAVKWARLFGGAGALIVIDGHENKLDQPLDPEEIEIGAYRGVVPFDRWAGISPEGEIFTHIQHPFDFGLPSRYRVNLQGSNESFTVHASRILRFCGPTVPTPELQAQMYWGISALEPAYEDIKKRDSASWNILSLTFRSSIMAMKNPDMAQMLSGSSMSSAALEQFYNRMQAINHLLSNQSMLLLPKDGGMETFNAHFTGLPDVYQQFQLDVSGAAEIPVSRLFGRTITGLGQSNDQDERMYEERIRMEQDESLRPQLDKLYPIICMSELGEIPEDIDLQFPSVRVMTEQEKIDLSSKASSSVTDLVGAGIFTEAMALKELKQLSVATGFGTNITDDDIAAAEERAAMRSPEGDFDVEQSGGAGEQGKPDRKVGDGAADPEKLVSRARDTAVVSRYDFAGIPVAVEYPAGVRRTLRNPRGKVVYDRKMLWDYGFIEGTKGRDGDEIDVIVGPGKADAGDDVYVVDMVDLGPDVDARQDEDKVLLGFANSKDAMAGFLSMYPREFHGGMQRFSLDSFRRDWLNQDAE